MNAEGFGTYALLQTGKDANLVGFLVAILSVKDPKICGNGRAVTRQLGNDAVCLGDGAGRTIFARIRVSDTERFIVAVVVDTVVIVVVVNHPVNVVVVVVIGFGLRLAERTGPHGGTVAIHGTVVWSVVHDGKEVIASSHITGGVFRLILTGATVLAGQGAQNVFGKRAAIVLQRIGTDRRSDRRGRQQGSKERRKLHDCLIVCLLIKAGERKELFRFFLSQREK